MHVSPFLLAVCLAVAAAAPCTFTVEHPLQFPAVQAAVRAHLAATPSLEDDIVVCLPEGTLDVAFSPLRFTAQDSPAGGNGRVIWQGAPGGTTVSGGVAVTGWAVSDALGGADTYAAPVPSGVIGGCLLVSLVHSAGVCRRLMRLKWC